MLLTPSQAVIATDRHRFRVVNCGRRFGKTTLAIEEIKGVAALGGKRVAYIANTYQQARDIAWEQLKHELEGAGTQVNESRLELRLRGVNGEESLIILRGWESIETLRGQMFDFIVVDEIASMRNFWSMWQEVIRPTLTDTKGEAMFISTPKGFNHFYDLFCMEGKDEDYKSFHFTSYDNPFIPSEEIDKASKELTEDRFAQEYMADFRKTEGLVYKEFDRARHVYTDRSLEPESCETLAGIDWGWTNPASSHKFKKGGDRHYWITEEFYKSQKTTAEIIEHVRTYGAQKVYPDPAEPDRNEEARRAGVNVRDVSKDIEAGIACVQELLKQGRLHVHSSCENLIWEFETYAYPPKKPDRNENELPIKENDHAMDEVRYVLYMQEGKNSTTQAHTHYPQSTQPRNNLPGGSLVPGAPKLPNQGLPKVAHTYIPRL